MANSVPHSRVVRFDVFEADLYSGELRKNGSKVRLQSQPFQVLAILLEHPGELVTRETLRERIWSADTFVDFDHALNVAITKIRVALGDDAENPRFVETVPRRGYRLVVSTFDGDASPREEKLPTTVATRSDLPETSSQPSEFHRRSVLLVIVTLLVCVIGGWTLYRHLRPIQPSIGHKTLLLVLPFDNLGPNSDQEFFADGITEEMITQLSSVRPNELGVIARVSAMRYKQLKKSLADVRTELGVDYVLEGSVRRDGNRVRITAQLIQVSDQSHVWAQSYDRDLRDVLAVQANVAESVARAVRVSVPVQGALSGASHSSPSPEGYDNYLQGQYHLHRYMRDDPKKASSYFEKALTTDPDFAPAHLGLASSFMATAFIEDSPLLVMPKAEAEAVRALELDPSSAMAHAMLAEINLRYHWDWQASEREARRALELNPNSLEAHDAMSDYLSLMGRDKEALAERQRTLELDPLWPEMSMEMGSTLESQRRYDEAIAAYRHAVELDPQMENDVHWAIGDVYRQKGMLKENIDEWLIFLKGNGQQARADRMAHLYATRGYEAAIHDFLLTAVERHNDRIAHGEHIEPLQMGDLYMRLGDKKEALAYLTRAYEEKSWNLPFYLKTNTELAGEPQFLELAHRVGVQ